MCVCVYDGLLRPKLVANNRIIIIIIKEAYGCVRRSTYLISFIKREGGCRSSVMLRCAVEWVTPDVSKVV